MKGNSCSRSFSAFFAAITAVLLFHTSTARAATPSTTKLSVSSSSVSTKTTVTLTASVTSNGTAVYPGQVLFCNADVPHCEDVAILGAAQLTTAGKATIRLRLGVGSHNVKAFVQGTTRTAATVPNAAPPRSPSESTAQLVTVKSAGTIPTATSLTANGKTGIFQLSSTVTTPARPIAGGSITFHDVANGDTALGVVPLNAGTSSLQLTPKSVPGGPSQIFESVSGDFNNDGIPDLAITYFEQTFLTILLGKGDGTFTAAPNALIGHSGGGMVVADFNSDGISDIAVGVYVDTTGNGCCTVSILLGKGDGSFTLQSSVPVGNQNRQLLAIDFNGDGIPDLAAVNSQDGTVTVALGNGDGSFIQI